MISGICTVLGFVVLVVVNFLSIAPPYCLGSIKATTQSSGFSLRLSTTGLTFTLQEVQLSYGTY